MKRTAFTLLELLLVLAIIATICGFGITSYQRQYARAQFKGGVVQIQVDLHKTRLLAMQSGEAYLFRYVPGTSVYEIAPLKTLQEVLYRIYGEVEDSDDGALGGSLTSGIVNSQIFSSESAYSDDLFSTENIQADMAARSCDLQESSQTDGNVGVTGLGGSLASTQSDQIGEVSTADSGTFDVNNYASATNALAADVSFPLGVSQDENSTSITFRDLNSHEKSLTKENSLAWRVNSDGVIVRKQATGDVVFTILRISRSTPSNLRTHRPKGSVSENSSNAVSSTGGVESKQALGGSLTSIPEISGDAEGLGGGLNEIPGETSFTGEFGAEAEEERNVSLWSEPIIFYPNGKTSSAVLGLESVGDYPYYSEIAIRGMTGVARISSISSIPPGADPSSSVLTREQLFRLSNPMNQSSETSTTGLATSGSSGGLENSSSTGSVTALSSEPGDLSGLNVPSDFGLSEEQTSSVNYGTGRRSGYQFNENVSSSVGDVTLGVSLGQSDQSTLNTTLDTLNDGTLNGTTPDILNAGALNGATTEKNQSKTTDENSMLNGGAL